MNKLLLSLLAPLIIFLTSCVNNAPDEHAQQKVRIDQHQKDSLTIEFLMKSLEKQQEVLVRLKEDNDSAEDAMLAALMEASSKPGATGIGGFIQYFGREYPRQCALTRRHAEALGDISKDAQSYTQEVNYTTVKGKKLEMMEQ